MIKMQINLRIELARVERTSREWHFMLPLKVYKVFLTTDSLRPWRRKIAVLNA
jgi:hypothetical protein